MTTIYAVAKGSYSDYHIMAVFSTKEVAERIAKQEEGVVEEYQLDAPNWKEQLSQVKENELGWGCSLSYRLTGLYGSFQEKLEAWNGSISNCLEEKDRVAFGDNSYYGGADDRRKTEWWMTTNVIAETQEAATKIATERFQAFIAKRAIEGKPIPRGKPRGQK